MEHENFFLVDPAKKLVQQAALTYPGLTYYRYELPNSAERSAKGVA